MLAGNPLKPPASPATAQPPPSAGPAAAHIGSGSVPADHVSVHFVDVDQAAAAVIEFPCAVVMIDSGARDQAGTNALVSYLNDLFARRPELHRHINTIFVTHSHTDHNYALQAVAEGFDVGGYVYNGHQSGSGAKNAKWMAAHVVSAKIPTDEVSEEKVDAQGTNGLTDGVIDSVACPRVDPSIKVLSGAYASNPGWDQGDFDNENNQSLAIRIDYGKASFLFTGDMQTAGLDTLIDHLGASGLLHAEVWAVSHHGAANGTDPAILQAIRPEIAVMSFGRPGLQQPWTAWAYGHPRRSTVEELDSAISRPRDVVQDVQVADAVKSFSSYTVHHAVYGTGWDGTVTIAADATGELWVQRQSPATH
jgi:beta-lactamase superfamily II metal-dependent hydrolase